ncbi:MAG: FtsX-like permease family protein [Gemmatimonadales bacterium]|nr:MAG: FtsX-like permease family protein [Gemmatimonadales bacterium]
MTLRALVQLAWREGRASRRRLLLLVAAIATGTAALVAINSFTANLRTAVSAEARGLLGADLALASRSPPTEALRTLADSLACAGAIPCGDRATVTTFSAMGYIPTRTGVRLVRVTAVEGVWPFFGSITTTPAGTWPRLQAERVALVDPAFLTALGASLGDTLALGDLRLPIVGTVDHVPGDVGITTAFGPRVFIPGALVPETGLLGFGARAQYDTYLRLPTGTVVEAIADSLRPRLRPDRVRVRTVQDEQRNLGNALERMGRFLGLVALVALLLGGLGVASAVHVMIRQKMETIAVLRCLGGSSRQVFALFLIQAAGIGLLGSTVGAAIGLAVQQALPRVLGEFLPVTVTPTVSWPALATGLCLGVWTAVAFALIPLLGIRKISPLATLRRPYEAEARPSRDRWTIIATLALMLSVVLMAMVQAGDPLRGAAFAAGIGVALAGLWFSAFALVWGLRKSFPHRLAYVWRQGLANLYRPANQTVSVVLSLGFGTFLLATLLLVQHNLLRSLRVDGGSRRPNLILFDIQPDQAAGVDSLLHARALLPTPAVPLVPMRIQSVGGRTVQDYSRDTTEVDGRPAGWALRREYRSTYRDSVVGSERVVAGSWWGPGTDSAGAPVSISVEVGLAEELGVSIGDQITWDVQGVPIASRVTSLREVDWARFETNFFVVFRPGALEAAPQTLVTLVRVDSASERGVIQRAIVEQFANISALDLSTVQRALDDIFGKVGAAIRFMAFFTLAAGLVVLLGSLATSRAQRLRETVLLKTLGASRAQVTRVAVAEYLALGTLAALTGLVLALGSGWALARWLFETKFALPGASMLLLATGVVTLTVGVGLWSSVDLFRRTPLDALRNE